MAILVKGGKNRMGMIGDIIGLSNSVVQCARWFFGK